MSNIIPFSGSEKQVVFDYGYIDGGFTKGGGGLRLTPLGEFAIAQQGTKQ